VTLSVGRIIQGNDILPPGGCLNQVLTLEHFTFRYGKGFVAGAAFMAVLKKQNRGEKAVPMLQASKKCCRRRRLQGRCISMGWLNDCGEMDQAIGALKKANNGKSGEIEYTIRLMKRKFKQCTGFAVLRHAIEHGIYIHTCTDGGKDDNVSRI
jgi:hypothetical protein